MERVLADAGHDASKSDLRDFWDVLNGSGEAYIASLRIGIDSDQDGIHVHSGDSGDTLEELLMAVGMRHKGFHPRTFSFIPFSVDGPTFAAKIERHWASIDAAGPEVVDLADILVAFGKRSSTIAFTQTN